MASSSDGGDAVPKLFASSCVTYMCTNSLTSIHSAAGVHVGLYPPRITSVNNWRQLLQPECSSYHPTMENPPDVKKPLSLLDLPTGFWGWTPQTLC